MAWRGGILWNRELEGRCRSFSSTEITKINRIEGIVENGEVMKLDGNSITFCWQKGDSAHQFR